jgi:hypothetical protein
MWICDYHGRCPFVTRQKSKAATTLLITEGQRRPIRRISYLEQVLVAFNLSSQPVRARDVPINNEKEARNLVLTSSSALMSCTTIFSIKNMMKGTILTGNFEELSEIPSKS